MSSRTNKEFNETDDFTFARNRDAWATIRGFVYQVDVTIDRWLELKTNETLELERGEDIDTVQQVVEDSNSENLEQLLEQVKVRETNLTLRSEPALSALASFYEHKKENKHLNFKFRYFTNANIVKERKLKDVDMPLLEAWQNIRNNSLKGKDAKKYLSDIRNLIKLSNKPSSEFNDKTWDSFKEFTEKSADTKLIEFIKSVEWATGQSDPDSISELLIKKIVEKYNVNESQSNSLYQRLFYYVFRIISNSGIKRLTVSELKTLLETSIFDEQDAVDKLFGKIESILSRIQNLETGQQNLETRQQKNDAEITTIKQKISEQNYVVEFDYPELHEACNKNSLKIADQTIDNQKTIRRLKYGNEIDQFLDKSVRYAITVGISGAGKSIVLSRQAKKLVEKDWTVVLLTISPGNTFNFANSVSKQIKENLSPEPKKLEWSQILKPWLNKDTFPKDNGLIILLDGLEASDPEHIVRQLEVLQASLGNASPKKVKVIFSCRDFDFQTIFQNKLHPLLIEAQNWRQSNRAYKLLEIYDFTSEELDEALLKIGAGDLLSVRDDKNKIDSHILSLRDLLKHPGTFEHFANLYERGEIQSIEEETWSSLIGRRIEYVIRNVSRQTDTDVEKIKEELIKFTEICRSLKSREFSLDSTVVKSNFPNWFESFKDTKSIYSALISNGMIFEQDVSNTKKLISFRITDAGAYLLSFTLEKELTKDDFDDLQQVCNDFISEAWGFSPMLDAMLAFIDRHCAYPYNDKILILLKTIADSHQYRTLFSLMRPTVLGAIFKLIRQNSSDMRIKSRIFYVFSAFSAETSAFSALKITY